MSESTEKFVGHGFWDEYRCDCGSTEKPIATLINGFECGWATCKECMISGNTQDFILRRK
jgi:hypothetical protein